MFKKENQKPIRLFIESPLVINSILITLSESRIELEGVKNMMIHCEEQESGVALMRAILGLEKIIKGTICIKTEKKELVIDKKRTADFFREDIRIAYVSKDGADYCRDLTIKENLNLIENNQDYNERIKQLAASFMVDENLDDFPASISIRRRKIFSIIRAWAYMPDIIVYSNPLEYLDDLSKLELLRNFAIPKEDLPWLSVIYVPSIGELSNVLHNFHLVEIIHSGKA